MDKPKTLLLTDSSPSGAERPLATLTLPISVLLIEDNVRDAQWIADLLAADGLAVRMERVDNLDSFKLALQRQAFHVILSDYSLPSFDGLTALAVARKTCPDTPFILVSGALGEETAVECLRAGASDYVLKQRLDRLGPVVRRALKEAEQQRQHRQAEAALARSEQQLRALTARLEKLREHERTRISREIHDELGQMLTAIKMDLRWMERRLDDFGDDRRVNPILEKLVETAELVDATVKTVQRIAAELRPGILDKLGLPMALQYEASEFEKRTGIPCRVALPPTDPLLRPGPATAFFRIFQEALTNVARHAGATLVEIEFRVDGSNGRLDIRDNGKGMSGVELATPQSLGLLGMQERARALGGCVSFAPRPGGGTVVRVHIPDIILPKDSP
jgi:signal transduction histidine kinase